MASAAVHCYACQGVFPTSTHPEERDEDGERLCPGCGSTFVELIDEERQQSQSSAAPRDGEGSAASTGDARGPRIEIRATFDQPAMPGPINFVEAISRFAPVQLPNGQQAFVLQVQDGLLSPLNMGLPFGDMFPRTMNPADWVVGDDLDVVVTRALDAYRPAPLPVPQPVVDALPRRRVRAGPLSPRPGAAVEQAAQAATAAAAEARSARAAAAAAAEARAARAARGAGTGGGQGSEERLVQLQLGVGQGEAGAVRVQLTPCGQGAGHGEQQGRDAGSGSEGQGGSAERAGEEPSGQGEWASCLPGEQCTVCHDAFETGGEVVELPCRHCFHEDCILPWLRQRNTCPVCRTRLEAARDPLRSAQRLQEDAAAREAQLEDTDRRFAASIERRMQEATPQEAERLRLQFLVPVQERQRRREERRRERQERLPQEQQRAPAAAAAAAAAQVPGGVPLVGMLQHVLQPPRAGPLSLQALAAAERAFAPLNERFQPLRCREDVPVGRSAPAQRPQPPPAGAAPRPAQRPQAAAANQGQPSLSFLPRGFLNMQPSTLMSGVAGALAGAAARAREREGAPGAAAVGRAPAGGAAGAAAGPAAGNGTASRGSSLRGGFFASRPTSRSAGDAPQQQQQAAAPGGGQQVPATGPNGTGGQAGAAGAPAGGAAGPLPDFHPQMAVYKQKAAHARARTQAIRERLASGAGTSGAAGPEGGAGASMAAAAGGSTSSERTAFYKEKAAHARARTQAILASMNPAMAAVLEQQRRQDSADAAAQEQGRGAPEGEEGDGEAEGAPGRQVARTSRADDAATRANAAGKQGPEEGGAAGAGGSRDAAAPAGRSAGGAPHVRTAGRVPVRAVAAGRRTGPRPGTRAASGGPGSPTGAQAQPQDGAGGPSSSGAGQGLDRTRSGSAGSGGGLNPISLVVGGAGAGLRFLAGAATGLLRRGGNGSSGGAGASSGGPAQVSSPPPPPA